MHLISKNFQEDLARINSVLNLNNPRLLENVSHLIIGWQKVNGLNPIAIFAGKLRAVEGNRINWTPSLISEMKAGKSTLRKHKIKILKQLFGNMEHWQLFLVIGRQEAADQNIRLTEACPFECHENKATQQIVGFMLKGWCASKGKQSLLESLQEYGQTKWHIAKLNKLLNKPQKLTSRQLSDFKNVFRRTYGWQEMLEQGRAA